VYYLVTTTWSAGNGRWGHLYLLTSNQKAESSNLSGDTSRITCILLVLPSNNEKANQIDVFER